MYHLDDLWIEADQQVFFEKEGYDVKECHKWMKEKRRSIKKDVFGFVNWVQAYNIRAIAIEYPVFIYKDDKPVAAGLLDLVCKATIKDEDITIAVDYKTGSGLYESYKLQLYAYSEGWNRDNPVKIESLYNYRTRDYRLPLKKNVKPYEFKCQDDPGNELRWNYYSDLFHIENKMPEEKAEIKATTINIESDLEELIEIVKPEDLFKEYMEELNEGENTKK
jgi:hypothetical protein